MKTASPMATQQVAYNALIAKFEEMRVTYQGSEIPQRLLDKAVAVLKVGELEIGPLVTKLEDECHVHFLAMWSRGVIPGRVTAQSLERVAARTDRLAEMLDRNGHEERAAALRAKAADYRANPKKYMNPEPTPIYKYKEITMKLSVAQQAVVDFVKNSGGATTTEGIKAAVPKLDGRVVHNLVKKGVLEQPREGTYRLPTEKVDPPKTAKAKGPSKPRVVKEAVNPSEKCLCGCGEQVPKTSRFRPGHDARLHGNVVRAAKGEKGDNAKFPKSELTLDYLRGAPWMSSDVAKAIGLDMKGQTPKAANKPAPEKKAEPKKAAKAKPDPKKSPPKAPKASPPKTEAAPPAPAEAVVPPAAQA